MLKNKKGLSLVLGAAMLLGTVQMPVMAGETQIPSPITVYDYVDMSNAVTVPTKATAMVSIVDASGNKIAVSGGSGWNGNWCTNTNWAEIADSNTNRRVKPVTVGDDTIYLLNANAENANLARKLDETKAIDTTTAAEYYISFVSTNLRSASGTVSTEAAAQKCIENEGKFYIGSTAEKNKEIVVKVYDANGTAEGTKFTATYSPAMVVEGGEIIENKNKTLTPGQVDKNLIYIKTNPDGNEDIKYQTVSYGENFDLTKWDIETSVNLSQDKYDYIGFGHVNYASIDAGMFQIEKYVSGSEVKAAIAEIDTIINAATKETYSSVKTQIDAKLALIPDCILKPEKEALYSKLDNVCSASDSPLVTYDYIDLSKSTKEVTDNKEISYYTESDGSNPAVSGGYGWASNSYWHTGTAASTDITTASNRVVRVRSTADGNVNLLAPKASGAGLYRTLANSIDLSGNNEYYLSFYTNNAMSANVSTEAHGAHENRVYIGKDFYFLTSDGVYVSENSDQNGYYLGTKSASDSANVLNMNKKIACSTVYKNLVYIKANADGAETVKYQAVPVGESFDYNNWDIEREVEVGTSCSYIGVQSVGYGCAELGMIEIEEYDADKKAVITNAVSSFETIVSDIKADNYSVKAKQVNDGLSEALKTVPDCYMKDEKISTLINGALEKNSATVVYEDFYANGEANATDGYSAGKYYLSQYPSASGTARAEGTYLTSWKNGGFGWGENWQEGMEYFSNSFRFYYGENSNGLVIATGNSNTVMDRAFDEEIALETGKEYYFKWGANLNTSKNYYVNSKLSTTFSFGDLFSVQTVGHGYETEAKSSDDTSGDNKVTLKMDFNGTERDLNIPMTTVDTGYEYDYIVKVVKKDNTSAEVSFKILTSADKFAGNWDDVFTVSNQTDLGTVSSFAFTGPSTRLDSVRVDVIDEDEIATITEIEKAIEKGDYTQTEIMKLKDSYAKSVLINKTSIVPNTMEITKLVWADAEANEYKRLEDAAGKAIKPTFTVMNTYTEAKEDLKVIVAAYQGGKLVECKSADLDAVVGVNEGVTIDKTLTVPSDITGYTIKLFVWDANLVPMTDTEVFTGEISVSSLLTPEDGEGAQTAPFSTINEAVYAAKSMAKFNLTNSENNEIKITLKKGLHYVDNTVEIDYANESIELVIDGEDGAVITGAKNINLENITSVTDTEVLSRLNDDIEDKIKMATIPEGIEIGEEDVFGNSASIIDRLGIEYNKTPTPVLMENGTMMIAARYPNKGEENEYITVSEIIEMGDVLRNWMSDRVGDEEYVAPGSEERETLDPLVFKTNDVENERLVSWANAEDVRVHGFWGNDWSDLAMGATVDENGQIKTQFPTVYKANENARFYVYNVLEELDAPGEYFIDKKNNVIYYYPEDENTKISIVALSSPIIELENAENVILKNIELTGSLNNAVNILNSNNVTVTVCTIKSVAGIGVEMSDCYNTTVSNCHIYDTGMGGITADGGDNVTLTPSNNLVYNNKIHDYSLKRAMYSPGIRLSGVGAIAKNNEIYNSDHMALNFAGNDHLIEYNDIHDVVRSTRDAAAIYAYESRVGRGNVIKNNYIHDIESDIVNDSDSYGVHAIYLDGKRDGTTVESNVFYNIRGSALWINAGRDNNFKNNICIETDYAVHFAYNKYADDTITYFSGMSEAQKTLYLEKYPELLKYNNLTTPLATRYNKVYDNVMVNIDCEVKYDDGIRYVSGVKDWFISQSAGEGQNLMQKPVLYSDSLSVGFKDYSNQNFELNEDSAIYESINDFTACDFANVGLK